jgi:hypothetical protein
MILAVAVGLVVALIAGAVLAAETTPTTKNFTGQIVSMDVKGLLITLREDIDKSGAEETTFAIEPNALVRIHGPKGKLDQLKAGDVVTVKYRMQERTRLAIEIAHF